MTGRRAIAAASLSLAAPGLMACESTQELSARRAAAAKTQLTSAKGSIVHTVNTGVRVERAAVVQDAAGTTAVVRLRNLRPESQVGLPVSIIVRDARGKVLYRNDVPGLDPGLTTLSALSAGGRAVWVNNQIPPAAAGARAETVEVRVGAPARTSRALPPELTVSGVHAGRDADGAYAKGQLVNTSKIEQRRVAVACVAASGKRVLAAGRAVVDRVGPVGGKPVAFTAFLTGRPAGASVQCTAAPTALTPGAK